MGGLRFGKSGDGSYGYYGADGSLVPFSNPFGYTMTKLKSANASPNATITYTNNTGKPILLLFWCNYNVASGSTQSTTFTFSKTNKSKKIGVTDSSRNDRSCHIVVLDRGSAVTCTCKYTSHGWVEVYSIA